MTDESDQQRISRDAYGRGQRDARVDAQLASHELRLNAINGSIERAAKASRETNAQLEKLIKKHDEAAAIESNRVKQLKDANEKQISTRQYWLGVAAIVVVLVSGQLAQIHIF